MKLIPNASKAHRLWSMRFIIAAAFFSSIIAAYALLPPDWLPAIPQWIKGALALTDLGCAGAAGVARVIDQPALREPENDDNAEHA
ncbi:MULTISPECIES: hypothetical protein [unclassified Rhodanobacter]|uniref:DUF7940 domain-containing protein n=1 Tax=unclassified Rhodanobacter TaxID=2621553 RepID=UPI001BDDE910|nr:MULTISPECIES: hypothetical protein [unclassified Rhodanobacter]MBT2142698.1 hypothetical protein [Rhodanobacter sp. LX-99]MBT2148229.1 hypothetical protein [Rhodanobacter sp. LX-100]